MAFEIKRHDLRPHWRVQLTADGVPVDLSNATSAVFIMKSGNGTAKVNRQPMTFIDKPSGVVEYVWTGTDTDTSNSFNAEVEVMWGTEPQTFPSSGYFAITISDDLG